jgi:hypothetical protein
MPSPSSPVSGPTPESPEPNWIELVRAQVASLRYGVVQLVVHEGRVTQIERTEKLRLPADSASAR